MPGRPHLTAIVLVSTVAEALLARLRQTPSAFPDEYVYSQLARSLASDGRLRVRGVSAHFPALLEPLLTAPVWFVHDVWPNAISGKVKGYVHPKSWYVDFSPVTVG